MVLDKPVARDILDFYAHDAERGEWYSRQTLSAEIGRDPRAITRKAELLIDMGLLEENDESSEYEYRRPKEMNVDKVYHHIMWLDDALLEVMDSQRGVEA